MSDQNHEVVPASEEAGGKGGIASSEPTGRFFKEQKHALVIDQDREFVEREDLQY